MIERLFPEEFPFGGQAYLKLEEQIAKLRQTLWALWEKLDSEGREAFDALSEIYLRQSNLAIKDAFEEGFSIAMDITFELRERAEKRTFTAQP